MGAAVAFVLIASLGAGCGGTSDDGGGEGAQAGPEVSMKMPWGEFKLSDEIRSQVASGEKLDIPVFTWVSGDEFFVPVRRGIADAAKDLGVNSSLIGPVEANQPQMINDITTYRSRNPAGMAVFLADPDSGKATINRLIEDGIPVVVWNADAPDTKRLAYVGTDNTEYGRSTGKLLLKKLQRKGIRSGTITVFSTDATAEYATDRLKGAKEVVNAELPGIKFATPVTVGTDISGAVGRVDAAIRGRDDVVGVFGTDEQVVAASLWAKNNAEKGEYVIVGHNLLPRQLELMRDGWLDGSVGQDPYQQGYMAVKWLHDFVTKGETDCTGCVPDFEAVDSAAQAKRMLETDCDGQGCA